MLLVAAPLSLLLFAVAPPSAALGTAPAPSVAGPVQAQAEGARERVATALEGAGELELEALWIRAEELLAGAGELGAESLAAAVDAALATASEPAARLLLVAARLRLPEPALDELSRALLALFDAPAPPVALGATRLAGATGPDGRPLLARVDPALRETLVAALSAGARDAARAPEVRLACAVSLRELATDGRTRRRAREEMLAFLDSADPRLRALGALALAEAGDVESGRVELERLAAVPGAEGRLAAAYLKQEDLRRLGDRRIQNEREQYQARRRSEETGEFPELTRMEAVLDLVRDTHLVGDRRSRDELVERALDGMLRRLDPYGGYLTGAEYAASLDQPPGASWTRIGAHVRTDPYDGLLSLTRVLPGGPAWRAGLSEGDKIVRLGSWPTIGRPIHEALRRLRGAPGERVDVFVWRRGMDAGLIDRPTDELAVTLELAEPPPAPVRAALLPEAIGLVEIVAVEPGTAAETRSALKGLVEQGASAFVLDLRGTAGEGLDAAAEIADLFLAPERLVVSTRSRVEDGRRLYSESEPVLGADVPLAVLVDRFTTTAGEVVAGALQDHGRAKVYGERTEGAGSARVELRIPGETDDLYTDANGNGRYDAGEPITRDWNENGRFDFAPRVRLAVVGLVLPGGRPLHRQVDETGDEVLEPGGIAPDVEARTPLLEAWEAEEAQHLRETGALRDLATGLAEREPALARELAFADGEDPARYPGFDELYAALRTALSADRVRELLRVELRRAVTEPGTTTPRGDFQVDLPLQEALSALLAATGRDWRAVEAFAASFDLAEDATAAGALIAGALTRLGRDSVTAAVAALEQALRGDRHLTPEELDRLQEILAAALEQP